MQLLRARYCLVCDTSVCWPALLMYPCTHQQANACCSQSHGSSVFYVLPLQASGIIPASMMSIVHIMIGLVFAFGPLRNLAKR